MVRNSGRKVSLSVVRSQDPEGPLGGLLLFVGARNAAGSFAGHPALSEIGLPLSEGRGDENLHRIRSPQYYLERKKTNEKYTSFLSSNFPRSLNFGIIVFASLLQSGIENSCKVHSLIERKKMALMT